jgi:predicted membrane protein
MHPVSFVKAHPVGVLVSMAAGMVIGPWLLGTLGRVSGVNVSLPTVNGGS